MNEEVDETGVHVSHCCEYHGCKYGDDDCPVENKTLKGDGSCETCYYDEIAVVLEMPQSNGLNHKFLSPRVFKMFKGPDAEKRAINFINENFRENSDYKICMNNIDFEVDSGDQLY